MSLGTSSRRVNIVMVGVLAVVVIATVALTANSLFSDDKPERTATQDVKTVSVTRGDVVRESTQQGLLVFADKRPLLAGRAGTVTSLAEEDAIVSRGGTLFSVDTAPVVLLVGTVPMWRDLQLGVPDGEDVRQLEQNLADMGMFSGTIDARYTWATYEAVRTWQESRGVEQSGVVTPASVVIAPGDIRVARIDARVGDRIVDSSVLGALSSTTRTVTVKLSLEQQKLAAPGTTVTITLPDGGELAGSVTAVGAPRDPSPSDGDKAAFVPVIVAPDSAADMHGFSEAQVSVLFPSAVVPNALTVPVQALIATAPETYAVQVLDQSGQIRDIPVTLGIFQSGVVEVSGDGIDEGVKVIVP